ncbi:hypothetical protein D3C75_1187180 [compost metagenome]
MFTDPLAHSVRCLLLPEIRLVQGCIKATRCQLSILLAEGMTLLDPDGISRFQPADLIICMEQADEIPHFTGQCRIIACLFCPEKCHHLFFSNSIRP